MSKIKIHYLEKDLYVNIIMINCRCVDIVVNDDLSIDMQVPVGMKWDMIKQYVELNKEKIFQEYERRKMRNHQVLPVTLELENGRLVYRSGLHLPYLGFMNLNLRVKYISDHEQTQLFLDKNSAKERTLTIKTDNDEQGFLRYCVMRYYRQCAGRIVDKKIREFAGKMNLDFNHVQITGRRLESTLRYPRLSYKNLEIRDQKTLWGSCSRKRNLRFDWKLAMLPIEIIEYIIVHELCHLKKMNHSDSFWFEIEKVMPEYKECRNWLDKHGKEYEIF